MNFLRRCLKELSIKNGGQIPREIEILKDEGKAQHKQQIHWQAGHTDLAPSTAYDSIHVVKSCFCAKSFLHQGKECEKAEFSKAPMSESRNAGSVRVEPHANQSQATALPMECLERFS